PSVVKPFLEPSRDNHLGIGEELKDLSTVPFQISEQGLTRAAERKESHNIWGHNTHFPAEAAALRSGLHHGSSVAHRQMMMPA
ncbi:MAG: hypothetical protein V1792_11870, partial [Pseudomonadota bacterium]